ncbi:MAG: hypothetical protein RLZZ110_479, partial [Bacteroidota bacterium]
SQKTLGDWGKEVVWFGVMALAMSLFTRIDVQMIQRYAGSVAQQGYEEIGLYARGRQ